MYSIRAVLAKQPVVIAGAIRGVIYALVLFGVFDVAAEQLAGGALALEGVLGLFAWASVTPNVTASETAASAYAVGRADEAARAGAGHGTP